MSFYHYGENRKSHQVAHESLYRKMDQQQRGNTRCSECNCECDTVMKSAFHLKSCIRQHKKNRYEVDKDRIIAFYQKLLNI